MKKRVKKVTAGGYFSTGKEDKGESRTIIMTQPQRGPMDIAKYTSAIKLAEHIDYPVLTRLYDLYANILMDTHLMSTLTKYTSSILFTPIEFKRNGVVDEKVQEQLRSPWFIKFLRDVLMTRWWGNSLFQFYRDDKGWINYQLIPRKHVDPIRRQIKKHQFDLTGVSWDEFDDLLHVGEPRDIGDLAKIAFWVIIKRNDVADWAQFAELFGQPLREGTYSGSDDDARKKLLEDLASLGGSAIFVHPEGSNLKIHDTATKSGTNDLYSGLANFCNAEISKAILLNTLTTEAGKVGTQALGTVHQEEEEKLFFFERLSLLNILNYELTDVLYNMGIDTRGGCFAWAVPENKDLTSRIDIDMRLKEAGLPFDDDYFYNTYGVPKPANYNEMKKQLAVTNTPQSKNIPDVEEEQLAQLSKKEKKSLKNFLNFFGSALGRGALEW